MKVFIALLLAVGFALVAFVIWPDVDDDRGEAGGVDTVDAAVTSAAEISGASRSEVTALELSDGQALPEPGFYSEEEYAQFKEDYNCELAVNARTQCEAVDRGPDGLEKCLKLSQYYTYSRHCGEQPD